MAITNPVFSLILVEGLAAVLEKYMSGDNSIAATVSAEKIQVYPKEKPFKKKLLYTIPLKTRDRDVLFTYGIEESLASCICSFAEHREIHDVSVVLSSTFRDIAAAGLTFIEELTGQTFSFRQPSPFLKDVTAAVCAPAIIFTYRLQAAGVLDERVYLWFSVPGFKKFFNTVCRSDFDIAGLLRILQSHTRAQHFFSLTFNLKERLDSLPANELQFVLNLLLRSGLNIRYLAHMSYIYYGTHDSRISRNISARNRSRLYSVYKKNSALFAGQSVELLEENLKLKVYPILYSLVRKNQLALPMSRALQHLSYRVIEQEYLGLTKNRSYVECLNDGLQSKRREELEQLLISDVSLLHGVPENITSAVFEKYSRPLSEVISDARASASRQSPLERIEKKIAVIELVNRLTNEQEYYAYYAGRFEGYLRQLQSDAAIQILIRESSYKDLVLCFSAYGNRSVIDRFKRNMSRNVQADFSEDLRLAAARTPAQRQLGEARKNIVEKVETLIASGRLVIEKPVTGK